MTRPGNEEAHRCTKRSEAATDTKKDHRWYRRAEKKAHGAHMREVGDQEVQRLASQRFPLPSPAAHSGAC